MQCCVLDKILKSNGASQMICGRGAWGGGGVLGDWSNIGC